MARSPTNMGHNFSRYSEERAGLEHASTQIGPEDSEERREADGRSTQPALVNQWHSEHKVTAFPTPPEELANHPRYEILQVLGYGGMGTVYKARHRFMDRVVALKIVHPRLLDRPEVIARFETEVRLAARLVHPNIVTAFDAEVYGSLHFLVMEFIEGRNLADLIGEEGALSIERACDYACQAARGLQRAFEQGMIHRDIKPHNLICALPHGAPSGREVVKILDFGLARLVRETHALDDRSTSSACCSGPASLTGAGAVMGTWSYMAPEQAEDPHTADIRADIYSLGCTLYHLLIGRPPFWGLSNEEKRRMHREGKVRPIWEARFDVSSELSAVVARMMAKDPADRYPTPASVEQALRAALPSSRSSLAPGGTAPVAPSPPHESRPISRRHFVRVGSLLGVLGGAAAVAGYRYFASQQAPSSSSSEPSSPVQAVVRPVRLQAHKTPIFSIRCSSDGESLVSGSKVGNICVWDRLRQQQRGRPFRGHTGNVRGVAFLRDNRQIISASEDGTARLWDAGTGREIARFPTNPVDKLTSVSVAPDGRWILFGGEQFTWVLEQATGEWVRHLPRRAESVVFSPDGRRAATGGWDMELHIWDMDSGRLLKTLTAHTMGIKSVDFSSDGTRMLSVGEDRKICLWDANRYTLVREWKGHKYWIWSGHFLPDGRRALTSSWDRTSRLWDLATGQEIMRFAPDPESEEFCCQTIGPNGRWAACAGADGIIYLWDLPA